MRSSATSFLSRKNHHVVAGASDLGSDDEAVQVLRIAEVQLGGQARAATAGLPWGPRAREEPRGRPVGRGPQLASSGLTHL